MGKKTVTLDNFTDFHAEVDGVEIYSHLPFEPYVPTTEIDVRLDNISKAARIGRLERVRIGAYTESNSTTVGINSLNTDGSASASYSVSATKAPRVNTQNHPLLNPILTKGDVDIKINVGHEDLESANLRQAKPWSKLLDTAISQGLREGGKEQLLDYLPLRVACVAILGILPISCLTALGSAASDSYSLSTVSQTAIGSYAGLMGMYNYLAFLNHSNKNKDRAESLEESLTPFIPLDRLGLVKLYTRTHKFVKVK